MRIPRRTPTEASRIVPCRRGAAIVEMAAVLLVFVMLLFGVLEFSRLLFVRQVLTNAAREGARYAVVNSYDTNVIADTQAVVKKYLAGQDKAYANYQCQVFRADSNGNNIGSAQDAAFGTFIGVEVSLQYTTITPSLLFMGKTLTMKSKCCMGSEAN